MYFYPQLTLEQAKEIVSLNDVSIKVVLCSLYSVCLCAHIRVHAGMLVDWILQFKKVKFISNNF